MATYAIARVRPGTGGRRVAGQALAAVPVAVVASVLTSFMISRGSLLGLAALLVVAGSLWFAFTSRPELALALVMLYLGALDGFLKLSTGSNLVTFVRDALLYAIVVGQLIRAIVKHRRLAVPPLRGWVFVFVVLVLVQLLNPQNGSLMHSLAGVRQNLEFVPLFYLTFAFVRTKKALRVFVILLALLATANGVVNVVQSRMTPQQLASWGSGYAQRVLGTNQFALSGRTFYDTTGQQHTRPFGLMSDAGTGGLVGALALGCILALASIRTRRRYLVLASFAAIAALAGIVTSQGRAVIVCSVVVVLAYAAMTATSRGRLMTIATTAVLSGVAFLAVSLFVGSSATRYSGLNASQFLQTTEQARGTAFSSIPTNLANYPFGSGLGSGGPAAGQSGGPVAATSANAENEISFATLETGIPGMLVIFGFTGLLFLLGLRRCRLEQDHETRVLLAAIIAPLAGILAIYWVSAVTPTTPCGPYLWAAGGIVSYWLVARRATQRHAVAAEWPTLPSTSVMVTSR